MYKIELQRWIEWWKDSRKRWLWLTVMDAALSVLQVLHAVTLVDGGHKIRCVILSLLAGLLFYMAVRGVFVIREITENIAGLEELLRQEELRDENDNMV